MVKPLFDDVQTSITNPVVVSTNNLVPALNTTQLTSAPSSAFVVITDDQIDKIGENNRVTAAGFSSKMLASVRASDVDLMGDKLNQLVATAKGLDPNKFAHGGIFSKLTGLFSNVKEKMLSEYQTVEKRMDTLVAEIDKSADNQRRRIVDLEDMYNLNVHVHDAFQADIDTIKSFLVELNNQLAQEKSLVNPDSFAALRVSDIQGRIDRAEKKIDDLERAKLLCKQLAPQIRLMQSNARALTQKFGDVKTMTIPAWKNAFTLYIVNIEQKKGAQLANAVSDATDEAFRMQADLLRQNTQEIGKATQRAVVSIEVIQHMQTQLLGSIDDMVKIADEGKKARADAAPKLLALEQELVTKFLPGSKS